MHIRELMSANVSACRAGTSLESAADLMQSARVGALPVVDDNGRVEGIITDRDLVLTAFKTGRTLADTSVHEAMSDRVLVCREGDEAKDALAAMTDHQVRRLVVVDDDGLLRGMLSLEDLAYAAREGGLLSSVGPKDVVRALAAISRRGEMSDENVVREQT